MHVISEKELEDILTLHPELIEQDIVLLERQAQLENRRTDLTFADREDNVLVVEIKKDEVIKENVDQIKDYKKRLSRKLVSPPRAMLVGQSISAEARAECRNSGIEYIEVDLEEIFHYLQQEDEPLYHSIFVQGKLHEKAKETKAIGFREYLGEISPLGVPVTSYQFFAPRDASPELSEDGEKNRVVADQFMNLLKSMECDSILFEGQARVSRKMDEDPRWKEKAKGAWKGWEVPYRLDVKGMEEPIPCEVYLGSIGYRGNTNTFSDGISRFMEVRVGKGKKQVKTQYGFHKHLMTNQEGLLPYFELKFNAKGLPKELWSDIYRTLEHYGFELMEGEKGKRFLVVGDIYLHSDNIETQLERLLVSLFSLTVVKGFYKGIGVVPLLPPSQGE
ncbi:endonuclease NucS domain-containing protein [Salimicrobium salexigens]|uniref:Endonuclease NucS C-terminal domain-containing protein n=1 Tax=Salimicrobium salexigens TaxID=908941 RepID=A0ABY1KVI4_9BACI|nr:endonuclease NucS domain-containing protein [Salimicrobium salexigens]SIS83020.1 Protein of unknown function DUF91 [Salimicrobium salexigens]